MQIKTTIKKQTCKSLFFSDVNKNLDQIDFEQYFYETLSEEEKRNEAFCGIFDEFAEEEIIDPFEEGSWELVDEVDGEEFVGEFDKDFWENLIEGFSKNLNQEEIPDGEKIDQKTIFEEIDKEEILKNILKK